MPGSKYAYIFYVCGIQLIYALPFLTTFACDLSSLQHILLHITTYHKYKHRASAMLVIDFKTVNFTPLTE